MGALDPGEVGEMVDITTASGGADPLLMIAIAVALWGILYWITQQPSRG